jgi:Anti-sigma-K factor rskA
MIPVKHIDPDDLALYAMQLLPPDETEEMSLHLQHSVEARRVLSEIYGDLAMYAHTAEMHSPPALARQRLMKHVAREKKAIPIDAVPQGTYAPRASTLFAEEPVKKSTTAHVMAWTGWAVAAGLLVATGIVYQQKIEMKNELVENVSRLNLSQAKAEEAALVLETMKDPGAVRVALTSTGAKPPASGRVSYLSDKGSLVFIASNLEPLQSYKTYELWLIPKGQDGQQPAPVPAGTFKPDLHGNATVVMPEIPKGLVAAAFGVTIEDGDGATSPTMPIILKGEAL